MGDNQVSATEQPPLDGFRATVLALMRMDIVEHPHHLPVSPFHYIEAEQYNPCTQPTFTGHSHILYPVEQKDIGTETVVEQRQQLSFHRTIVALSHLIPLRQRNLEVQGVGVVVAVLWPGWIEIGFLSHF